MGDLARHIVDDRIGHDVLRHDDLGDPCRCSGGWPAQMHAVGAQRLGELLADQRTHTLSGHRPGQPGHQPAEGQRVVGRFAQQTSRTRRGEPFFHHDVIQQVFLCRTSQTRQAGVVPHHLTNGEVRLAVGAELRPVLGNRRVVVDQPPVGEPVDHGGSHTLGCREHHRCSIRRPWQFAIPIRPARPHVDDGLAVEIHRQRPAAESARREHRRKPTNDASKVWVRRAGHAMTCVKGIARRDRAEIDPGFCLHAFEFTSNTHIPRANND